MKVSIHEMARKAFAAQSIEDKLASIRELDGALSHLTRIDPTPGASRLKADDFTDLSLDRTAAERVDSMIDNSQSWAGSERTPAYPPKLDLVVPQHVGRRRLGSAKGRAELLHAIAHIEWHAIHLAIDAALRFDAMPFRYMLDWLGVAVDEARHFSMLNRYLRDRYDIEYGDCPAHAGMWDMARKTEHDVVARMALVPRVLEARGLDVTPGMISGLTRHGDPGAASCLRVILSEEVRHVWLGTHWYQEVCRQRGLEPESHFFHLLEIYNTPKTRGPLNRSDRERAGFSKTELDQLAELVDPGEGKKSTGVIS